MKNLRTATPTEIDTELLRLDGDLNRAEAKLINAWSTIHDAADDRKVYQGKRRVWGMTNEEALAKVQAKTADETHLGSDASKALVSLEQAIQAIKALEAEANVYNAVYNRRPWTRAYLAITNGGGHVHSSQQCPTCNNGIYRTQFVRRPEYSGADEALIIADAGYRACTKCYPNAPVDATADTHPTKIFSADEITAAEARAAREEAKRARDQQKIANGLTADGSQFVIEWADGGYRDNGDGSMGWDDDAATRKEYFQTERAASIWYVDAHVYPSRRTTPSKRAAYARIVQAMADKHGKTVADVQAEMDAKVAAKKKRDGV